MAIILSQNRFGAAAEVAALRLVISWGYLSEIRHDAHNGDLFVYHDSGPVRIEVKAANFSKKYGFKFCLHRETVDDRGHIQVRASITSVDYVLLLCFMPSGRMVHYLIPALQLVGQKQLSISSTPEKYRGKYAVYRGLTLKIHGRETI